LREAARLADIYGNGEIRITTSQNVIIPNVPEDDLSRLLAEPLLLELSADPPEVIRGLVACTGKDYCHFSLIETKELAVKTARSLASTVGRTGPLSMRWSGCPNGCGNHLDADIGILGKRAKIDGEVVDAVDIFLNLTNGSTDEPREGQSKPGQRIENVPCTELPQVLEGIIKSGAGAATHA
jgi:ferredoxin-nitrite reductase